MFVVGIVNHTQGVTMDPVIACGLVLFWVGLSLEGLKSIAP